MADISPFLGSPGSATPSELPKKDVGASPPEGEKKENQARAASPFSIRPAAPAASSPQQSSGDVPGVVSSSKDPSGAPQVIKGPSMTESDRLAREKLLAPDEDEVKKKRKRIFWVVLGILLTAGIAMSLYWWWQRPGEEVTPITDPKPAEVPSTSQAPAVLEEVPSVLLDDAANYRSENFKVGEIVLLGEAQFLQMDEGIAPLSIDGIRGEAFTEKNKQEVKLVITWNTNKLATASVSYAKGIGQTPKIVETDDLAYDHSIILTGLDPASTYLYTIQATDRFGNVVTSEPYAVFTGARSVSLFDLIAGAIGEVFGWAVK